MNRIYVIEEFIWNDYDCPTRWTVVAKNRKRLLEIIGMKREDVMWPICIGFSPLKEGVYF